MFQFLLVRLLVSSLTTSPSFLIVSIPFGSIISPPPLSLRNMYDTFQFLLVRLLAAQKANISQVFRRFNSFWFDY